MLHIVRMLVVSSLAAPLLASCATKAAEDPMTESTDLPFPETATQVGLVHHSADGNRIVGGTSASCPNAWQDIALEGLAERVAGVAVGDGAVWAVATSTGTVEGVQLTEGRLESIALAGSASALQPPVLRASGDEVTLLNAQVPDTARSITFLPGAEQIAYLTEDSLVVGDTTLEVDPLPDAKLLVDERDRLLFLAGPTTRYNHAVLGDPLEASEVVLVTTTENPPLVQRWAVDPSVVIEGVAPIWVDLDGDDAREVVVTLSNASDGARLAAFSEEGELVAQSSPIGTGYRWRHQLAAGPFRRAGERTIISVRTPHIGGPVELFRLDGDRLGLAVETVTGHTSHEYASPNLDRAVAFDCDGDGDLELVIPDPSAFALGVHQVTSSEVSVESSLPLSGRLSTNLAAVATTGGVALAVGSGNGLRVFVAGDAD